VTGSCENGSEHFGEKKTRDFLTRLPTISLSIRILLSADNYLIRYKHGLVAQC
jgi:hypothetical protein